MAKVRSYIRELPEGRKVAVGYNTEADDDASYFLTFTNSEGEETRLRISAEAFDAVVDLRKTVDRVRVGLSPERWEWKLCEPVAQAT